MTPCNAAKMREALVKTSQFLSKLGEWLKVNDEGQEYALAAGMIHTLVEHALSKPPRNCDRFNNEMEMQFAFLAELISMGINGASLEEYSKWLLAEAKGASNESK